MYDSKFKYEISRFQLSLQLGSNHQYAKTVYFYTYHSYIIIHNFNGIFQNLSMNNQSAYSNRLSFTSIINSRQIKQPMVSSRISAHSEIQPVSQMNFPSLNQLMEQFEEYPDEEYILRCSEYYHQEYIEEDEGRYYEESFQFGQNPLEKWIASQSQVKIKKKQLKQNRPMLHNRKGPSMLQNKGENYNIRLTDRNQKPQKLTQMANQYITNKGNPINQPSNNSSQIISSVASEDFRSSLDLGESSLYRYKNMENTDRKYEQNNFNSKQTKYFGNAKIIQSQAYQPQETNNQNKGKQSHKKNIIWKNKKNRMIGTSQQIQKTERDLNKTNHPRQKENNLNQVQKQISDYLDIKNQHRQQFGAGYFNEGQHHGVGYSFASNCRQEDGQPKNQQTHQIQQSIVETRQDKKVKQEQEKIDKLTFIAITKSEEDNLYTEQIASYNYSEEQNSKTQSQLMDNESDIMPINSEIHFQSEEKLGSNLQQLNQKSQVQKDEMMLCSEKIEPIQLPNLSVEKPSENIPDVKKKEKELSEHNDEHIISDNSRSYDINYTSYPQSNLNSHFDDSQAHEDSGYMFPEIQSKCKDDCMSEYHKNNDPLDEKQSDKEDSKIGKIFVGVIQEQESKNKLQPQLFNQKRQYELQDPEIHDQFKGQLKIETFSNFQKDQTIQHQSQSSRESVSTLEALQLLKMKTQGYNEASALSSQKIEQDLSVDFKNTSILRQANVMKKMISMPENSINFGVEIQMQDKQSMQPCRSSMMMDQEKSAQSLEENNNYDSKQLQRNQQPSITSFNKQNTEQCRQNGKIQRVVEVKKQKDLGATDRKQSETLILQQKSSSSEQIKQSDKFTQINQEIVQDKNISEQSIKDCGEDMQSVSITKQEKVYDSINNIPGFTKQLQESQNINQNSQLMNCQLHEQTITPVQQPPVLSQLQETLKQQEPLINELEQIIQEEPISPKLSLPVIQDTMQQQTPKEQSCEQLSKLQEQKSPQIPSTSINQVEVKDKEQSLKQEEVFQFELDF